MEDDFMIDEDGVQLSRKDFLEGIEIIRCDLSDDEYEDDES